MTRTVRIRPGYVPLTQQKFLCFPCCIQWVLLRRGLKMIPQEQMAKELGITVRSGGNKFFNTKLNTAKMEGRSVRWSKKVLLPAFFKKHGIPLTTERALPSSLKDPKEFISMSLAAGNDVIVSLNMTPLRHKLILKDRYDYGHSMILDAIRISGSCRVRLGDPAYMAKKFIWVTLDALLDGMSDRHDGVERPFSVFRSSDPH